MAWEPVRVLLVEDDEDDFVLTRDLLREIGSARFEVEWAPDYDQALATLEKGRHEVGLVDYRLGSRNGVDFLKDAAARGIDVPIILLTGQGDWEVDLAAMEAGAADFLTKSQITPALLERSIRYSIQQRRTERSRLRLLQEQAARREAEAANKAKDEFIAVVSHELRTPLNAILGWTQLLKSGTLDGATQSQALDTIERNAKAQSRLIEDLLDMSRIESGKVRLEQTPVRLSVIVEAAIDGVLPTAEARSLHLHRAVEDVGVVTGDATRLQQVAWNLLTNAVKFTPDRGRVTVELRRDDHTATLRITDTGQGIEPAFLPHVFDRFKQGNNEAAEHHQQGLGLGLAIVRQLVELHRGAVHAESPGPGQGSTFTVTLPLASPDRAATDAAPQAHDQTAPKAAAV